jgi:hypothetical protein
MLPNVIGSIGSFRRLSAIRFTRFNCGLPHTHLSSVAVGSARLRSQGGVAMSRERRLDQANDEPSLAMSFIVLCVVLAAMVAIVTNISIPDIQLSTAADLFDGPS